MSLPRIQPGPGRSMSRLAAVLCLAVVLGLAGGCGLFSKPYKPTLLKTRQLVFYLDRRFNQGMTLPLDVCFVLVKGTPDSILKISPEDWFAKDKRDKYAYKQALSFHPRQHSPVKVVLQVPPDTQDLVIVADYINLTGAKGQQLVITAPGKPQEVIFVTDKGIYR